MLDPLLAESAARTATEEDKKTLRQIIQHHERDFYLTLAKISGNRFFMILQELFIEILLHFEFSNSISDLQSTREQIPYNNETLVAHTNIVNAIVRNDPEAARRFMVEHRNTWYTMLKELMKKA